jgi:formylglycine-generating enzyme required for sulfatase activity
MRILHKYILKEMPKALVLALALTAAAAPATQPQDRLGEMIAIPAGKFLMGNNGNEGFNNPDELPQHWVDLPAYQIGKYEVTRGQYRKFIEASGGYRTNQSAPVGSYPAGASPYGCMDMAGNAHEWVADWAKSYPGNPKPFDYTGRFHFVKGTCWDDGPFSLRCGYRNWYLPPGSSGTGKGDSDYIGFRIAR